MGRVRGLIFGVVVLATLALLVQVVRANHLFGRTYTGTISGGRGTVRFTVSSTGTTITSFTHDLAATGCGPRAFLNAALTNHAFTGTSGVSNVSGTFPTSGTASGTLTTGIVGSTCRLSGASWSASSQVTATATPAPLSPFAPSSPAPTIDNKLPITGSPAAVFALSGLSLLELGYGLRLLSRRFQRPVRSIPAYLLRRLMRAEQRGADGVRVAEDWYLVRRKPGRGPTEE